MNGVAGAALSQVGSISLLLTDTVRETVRRRLEWGVLLGQAYHLGVRSLAIATVTALFTGMVLALQTSYSLAAYGARTFVGDVVALSLVRELGPVLTSLMVGGRVGAGITAELGSMAVTEQVDAIRALAANPIRKLVVPRVGALVIALPLLTILADTVALFGGLLMAMFEIGQTRLYFMNHVLSALSIEDILSGVGKTVFFAVFIGVIACYNGINARGGADGVGKATTNTVVVSSLSVIISDFFLTKLFIMLS